MGEPKKHTTLSDQPAAGTESAGTGLPSPLFRQEAGAFGTFTVTHDISAYTRARLFDIVGKQTTLFARFSTVDGEEVTVSAPCEFAVRFYTEDGPWDVAGSHTPVFFASDPDKAPDIGTALPVGTNSATRQWDYWSQHPESLHRVMLLLSDRGTPYSYRHLHGYGVRTFSFSNAGDERFLAKLHFRTAQGIQNATAQEATDRTAKNPGFARRDLSEAIDRGDFPRWYVHIQVMSETDAQTCRYNPFDLTTVWPHADYPLREVGVLKLDRNPVGGSVSAGPLAFDPVYCVDGIGYPPAGEGAVSEWANNPYSQPGNLYRQVMSVAQRRALIASVVSAMSSIDGPRRDPIINLQLCHWFRTDLTLGMAIAQGLGLDMHTLTSLTMHPHG